MENERSRCGQINNYEGMTVHPTQPYVWQGGSPQIQLAVLSLLLYFLQKIRLSCCICLSEFA